MTNTMLLADITRDSAPHPISEGSLPLEKGQKHWRTFFKLYKYATDLRYCEKTVRPSPIFPSTLCFMESDFTSPSQVNSSVVHGLVKEQHLGHLPPFKTQLPGPEGSYRIKCRSLIKHQGSECTSIALHLLLQCNERVKWNYGGWLLCTVWLRQGRFRAWLI